MTFSDAGMTEDIQRHRVEEMLKKSGFPLEIEFSSFLEQKGWSVASSTFHQDQDQGIPREIDLIGWKILHEASGGRKLDPYELGVNLIIECKKSEEYDWVFYTRPRKRNLEFYGPQYPKGLLYTDFMEFVRTRSLLPVAFPALAIRHEQQFGPLTAVLSPQIARQLTDTQQMGIAHAGNLRCLETDAKSIHHEEVPRQNRPNDLSVYEVARGLWKATWDAMILSKSMMTVMLESISKGVRLPSQKWPIHLFLPIVVFDGRMWNWIAEEKRVDKIDEVVLQVHFPSLNYPSPSALICIAQKERAFSLITDIEEDMSKIADLVSSNLVKLNGQIDTIEQGMHV